MDGDVDLREALRVLVDVVMDLSEVPPIGALRRRTQPGAGHLPQRLAPAPYPGAASMALHIPKLREELLPQPAGTAPAHREPPCWPSSSKPHVEGVSTRPRVDDLIGLGCDGISGSQVSASASNQSGGEFHLGPWTVVPTRYVWLAA